MRQVLSFLLSACIQMLLLQPLCEAQTSNSSTSSEQNSVNLPKIRSTSSGKIEPLAIDNLIGVANDRIYFVGPEVFKSPPFEGICLSMNYYQLKSDKDFKVTVIHCLDKKLNFIKKLPIIAGKSNLINFSIYLINNTFHFFRVNSLPDKSYELTYSTYDLEGKPILAEQQIAINKDYAKMKSLDRGLYHSVTSEQFMLNISPDSTKLLIYYFISENKSLKFSLFDLIENKILWNSDFVIKEEKLHANLMALGVNNLGNVFAITRDLTYSGIANRSQNDDKYFVLTISDNGLKKTKQPFKEDKHRAWYNYGEIYIDPNQNFHYLVSYTNYTIENSIERNQLTHGIAYIKVNGFTADRMLEKYISFSPFYEQQNKFSLDRFFIDKISLTENGELLFVAQEVINISITSAHDVVNLDGSISTVTTSSATYSRAPGAGFSTTISSYERIVACKIREDGTIAYLKLIPKVGDKPFLSGIAPRNKLKEFERFTYGGLITLIKGDNICLLYNECNKQALKKTYIEKMSFEADDVMQLSAVTIDEKGNVSSPVRLWGGTGIGNYAELSKSLFYRNDKNSIGFFLAGLSGTKSDKKQDQFILNIEY